ncbi:MAG: gluconate 2-dehydrogenase subunit 3 family protein [SAR324 cluster bacterium]|nr:gluconate 2-dehydrogenase subunit 3 family protein [SAR324 cluster bacterium]
MKSTFSTTHLWNSGQLVLLNGILAQLIPSGANGKIPSAAEFGVADFIAQKISDNTELQLLFAQGLEYLETLLQRSEKTAAELSNKEWIALVSQLEKSQPSFFEMLLRATYMGYYSESAIRPLFGLSAGPTQPEGYLVPADDPMELDRMLEPVRQRGACYREC